MTDLGDPATFAIASQPVDPVIRDFYSERPASDELFTEFVRLYEYGDVPLDERVEAVDTVAVGIRERITFDAGYGQERMVLYLFRPLEPAGPLQTVVYFPTSNALNATNFGGSSRTISMIVRSGRAFAFPIYKSTYERQDDYVYRLQDPSNDHREHVLQWRQDLGRSLDYLQTRPDVDSNRFAYFGYSWGGQFGAIMLAVEPRFRAAVLTVPGFSPLPTQPVVDPFNFVSRVRLPVLMLSGEYDQTFPLETAARPFFDFLAVSPEFQENRREENPSDSTLTLAALNHKIPIYVEVHGEGRRFALGCVDLVIEHDLDAALAPARDRQRGTVRAV